MEARHWRVGALAAALLASPALALEDAEPVEEAAGREDGLGFEHLGLSLQGGISTYTGNLGSVTNLGAYLGVTADVQALRWLDLELGYEGSNNSLLGGNQTGELWRNNVSTLAKVGPVLGDWRPFVGAGFGVSFIDPTSRAEALGFESDFVTEVPLTAGLDLQMGKVMLGARATYRLIGSEDLGLVSSGNLFNAGASVGIRF
ncbi:acyloxyacyl hydrolase [Myxococcaceae bacterium GXIMD 01537]